MYSNVITVLLLCVTCSYAYRHVVRSINVNNGGRWGDWHSAKYCPSGQYAIGYKLKIEKKQGRGDDTSLNGIKILCGTTDRRSIHGYTATSGVGKWGDWYHSFAVCPKGEFLTSFKLQVERPIGRGDDTSANFVIFRCRPLNGGNERQLSQGRGYGFWGDFGGWSGTCPLNSAICGLETRVEPHIRGDDTALNDVQFKCCED